MDSVRFLSVVLLGVAIGGIAYSASAEDRSVEFLIEAGDDPIQPGVHRTMGLMMVDSGDLSRKKQSHDDLPDFPINITLQYVDRHNRQQERSYVSTYRCCGTYFGADIRIPRDAKEGSNAVLELKFEDSEIDGYRSVPTRAQIHILPFIDREPEYLSSNPLFGTFMFFGDIPMWAVLDQSAQGSESGYYDVLYLDLNANGDLRESNERFEGVLDVSKGNVKFRVDEFVDPCNGWNFGKFYGEHLHKEWTISASRSTNPNVQFRLLMDGDYWVSGPMSGEMIFSGEKLSAPVQAVFASESFRFKMNKNSTVWRIGAEENIHAQLYIDIRSPYPTAIVESASFSDDIPVEVRLSYTSRNGGAKVYTKPIRRSKAEPGFSGVVKVPGDARAGKAKVQFMLPGRALTEGSRLMMVTTRTGGEVAVGPTESEIDLVYQES